MSVNTHSLRLVLFLTVISASACSLANRRNRQEAPPDGVNSFTEPTYDPGAKRRYNNPDTSHGRTTREDFLDLSQDEGSLWASTGQTNYYFTKNKVRNPGDIITLVIDNDLYRELGMEIKQNLSPREKSIELEKVREKYQAKYLVAGAFDKSRPSESKAETPPIPAANPSAGAPGPVNPAESSVVSNSVEMPAPRNMEEFEKNIANTSLANVDINSSIQLKTGDKMMGEILERYPNGNYKIKATKRITYDKGPPRLVSITGVIKASDIEDETDSINAGKLYEYRVEVSH